MKTFINTFIALALLIQGATVLRAADDKDVALVLKTLGKVELNKQGYSSWAAAKRGNRLNSGEVVRTGDKSLAAIVFTDDKSLLKVRSNSRITVTGQREEDNSIVKRIQLSFGQIWAKVTKQRSSMRVESPSGVATVKGTEFNCLVADGNFIIYCREGLIELANQFGTLLLGADEMARLTQNSGPQRIQGNPDQIFEQDEDGGQKSLEIEYEDEAGNKKTLILEFE